MPSWMVGPPVGDEPIHTQHHEGDYQEDGDSHRALRALVPLSGPFRSGRSCPAWPAVGSGGGPEKG
jgi:hypothetical protein